MAHSQVKRQEKEKAGCLQKSEFTRIIVCTPVKICEERVHPLIPIFFVYVRDRMYGIEEK